MRKRGAVAVAILGLALAAGALADDGKRQIHFSAADQVAARAAVIRPSDLGSTGWKGGMKKPDLSGPPTCPSYNPKQSDLVLTGAAESDYTKAGVDFDSEADVLQTAEMVKLDWERSVLAPALLPCFRSTIAKSPPPNGRILSFNRRSFPHLATYSASYRLLLDIRESGTTVRVMSDFVLVGRGRTEITLIVTAPFGARADVEAAEIRVAKLLLGRATA